MKEDGLLGEFMELKKDVVKAVLKHQRKICRQAANRPPPYIPMKTIVYWNNLTTKVFDYGDKPELVLQDVLRGIDLVDQLAQTGAVCASLSGGRIPIGITVSTETLMADKIEIGNASRKVNGMPVLLVAGRNASGKMHVSLTPLALDDSEHRFVPDGAVLSAPIALEKKLEAMKEMTTDFMGGFFDAFNNELRDIRPQAGS
jgi:hypothetical protein